MREFLADYWLFIRRNRNYWLIPFLLVLLLLGGVIFLSQGSVFSPFIYTLF
jgi:hypothetical protein